MKTFFKKLTKKMYMGNLKELEIQGCRTFVCPNLGIIDKRCKEFNVREDIIEKSKNIAIRYFKKTYHEPHYSSAMYVLPSTVYIAHILEGDKKSQNYIAKMFGVSVCTIKKWYLDIVGVLDIEIVEEEKKIKMSRIDTVDEFFKIYKYGESLSLQEDTIERAINLARRYFEKVGIDNCYRHVKHLRVAFIYTASVIENDGITQLDIYKISGISETTISKWYHDIMKNLGIKIISHHGHTIKVIEGQYDD